MYKFVLKRLFFGLITIIGISVMIFSIIHLIPGDPIEIMFGKSPNKEAIEIARKFYNLDKPVVEQYFMWVNNLLNGDLGESIMDGRQVSELITPRIGRSLMLASVGVIISLILSIPLGIITAWRHNSWVDFNLTTVSLVLISIPEFWLGVMLMLLFSVTLKILPISGYISPFVDIVGWSKIIILPACTIGFIQAAQTTRMIRANLLEVLGLDYIKLMKAAGVVNSRILLVHAFRNAFIPVLTLIGMQFGYLMGGVIIVEQVFRYPGLGNLMIKSLMERNYPVLQACIMVYAIVFVLINIIVDLLYSVVNPKVRSQ